jgi:hypothetical protein
MISPDSAEGALAPFSPLRKRVEMDALFFRERELLEADNFVRSLGAFAGTFFGFTIGDV